MKSYRIPHEFRHTRYTIVGPFTPRELAYICIGLAPVMWTLPAENLPIFFRFGLPGLTFLASLVLTLGKWRKESFLSWVPRLVYYYLNPKARVWKPDRGFNPDV